MSNSAADVSVFRSTPAPSNPGLTTPRQIEVQDSEAGDSEDMGSKIGDIDIALVLSLIVVVLALLFIVVTIKKKCSERKGQGKDSNSAPPQPQPRVFLPTKGQKLKQYFKTEFLPRFNRHPSTQFRPNAVHPEPVFEPDPNVDASQPKPSQQTSQSQDEKRWSNERGETSEKQKPHTANPLPLPGTPAAGGPEPFEQIEARVVSELLAIKRSIKDPAQRRSELKKLQARWHPDKNPQDPEVAKKIFQVIMHHKQEILGG